MNSIKIYLLPLFFALFFSAPIFAQSNSSLIGEGIDKSVSSLSKTDSMLVYGYFTEYDYNKLHGIKQIEIIETDEFHYDEIYPNEKHRKRKESTFLNEVAVEVIVEVVINTLLFVTLFWQ